MKNHGKLAREAHKRGYESVAEMVAAALAVSPSIGGAAANIGVAPNAIAYWMTVNGYEVIVERKARLVRADSGLPEGE